MPWRFHGHARPDPTKTSAQGICDSCNFSYQLSELKFQYEWRGTSLQNTWFRKCPKCLDKPAEFLKTILLPADPVPVSYPRPNQFFEQMNSGSGATTWDQLNKTWDSDSGGGTQTNWQP